MILEDLRRRIVGERRAIALLSLGALTTLFVLVALAQGGAWAACFGALALTYSIAFFGVAAEWFWGRWFAVGLATSGLTMAGLGLVTAGWNPALVVWGLFHLVVYLPLLGAEMSERYELQSAWRERYNLDDAAVARIKRAVHSTATALPTLIFYTLAPREDQALVLMGLGLLVVGTAGLLRMRVWGVLLMIGAAGVTASSLLVSTAPASLAIGIDQWVPLTPFALVAIAAMLWGVAPFLRPMWRSLHASR